MTLRDRWHWLCVVGMIVAASAPGQARTPKAPGPLPGRYIALPLAGDRGGQATPPVLDRYGIPFVESVLPLVPGGSAQAPVGGQVDRIFLLGMTDAAQASLSADTQTYSLRAGTGPKTIAAYGWADPRDDSFRFFVGDELGSIRLDYTDGVSEEYPLRLGENVWFGRAFYDFQDPFAEDAALRKAFAASLDLYPPAPLADGNYVAVIAPRHVPLRSLTVVNSPAKRGTFLLKGMTVESHDPALSGLATFPARALAPEMEAFARSKALHRRGQDETEASRRLEDLRRALYSSDEQFRRPVPPAAPPGYAGPQVTFRGSVSAEILSNAFAYNVADILAKIDKDGLYHTSTRDALSWGGYRGFGTFRRDVGSYYGDSYTRDMGRSLEEVAVLGYTGDVARAIEYALTMARAYTTEPSLKVGDVTLPPHWGRLVNHPGKVSNENDGQGLTILAMFKLWQRLPNRHAWLRQHWTDVKASGDWILWQFAHPEISGARQGLLHTTGESADGDGYSVYPDAVCMHALRALAQMADSVGEEAAAGQWRQRADQMQDAITRRYVVDDTKFGRVWTLEFANWTHRSTVLGPLIFQADFQGFAPEDSVPMWREMNEGSYRRLLASYRPFGFYGQSMGYGQGFVTQSALLLDRMHDASTMLEWAGKQIYDPRFGSFIVPEGVEIDRTGRFWFRIGDLGNGVQEAEIVKALRLVLGVDDTQPARLQFFPRMPFGWTEMSVAKYPVVFAGPHGVERASLTYRLTRVQGRMELKISADRELGGVAMRLGPFARPPKASAVRVNGRIPAEAVAEHSGDSWWMRFRAAVGPSPGGLGERLVQHDTSPHAASVLTQLSR